MIALLSSMFIWGTLGVFVLWSGIPALDVAFYRCLIGALFIGGWLIKSKEKIGLDKHLSIVALAGICLVLNWVFLFESFRVSTITIGNMSYYLQPIILIILGIFIYKEKVSLPQWVLIAMALAGVLLTIDVHNLGSPYVVLGIGYALVAALFYSFLTVLMKPVRLGYFKVIFVQLAIGVFILLPFVHFQYVEITSLICLLLIGLFHTLLAYYLYYKAIQTASFTQIGVASYLDPLVAIASDVIFFNRQLNVFQIFGVGLTFMALYLLITASKRQRHALA